MGFRGNPIELMDPKVNSKYAALYLKYQVSRYGEDNWCVLTAAYNSGTYRESKKRPGPKNLGYVRLVQKKLPEEFKDRLSCENMEMAENL